MTEIREYYSDVEFSRYSQLAGLFRNEEFLINKYCTKEMRILEGGTGGGRVLLGMQRLGFRDLHGFDFVPALINAARERDRSGQIEFRVGDAVKLDYEDESFDLLFYLGPLLSNIESSEARLSAVKEAHRILRDNGIGIFSFASYDVRIQSALYRAYSAYIKCLRRVKRCGLSEQSLPFLRMDDKVNYHALLDKPPHPYWFVMEEAVELFTGTGFTMEACATDYQIRGDHLCSSLSELRGLPHSGNLFIVCRKPDTNS